MSKMIQIRHVPDVLHRRLKTRAAEAGMTLSDYLLAELRKLAERPTPQQLWERLRSYEPFEPSVSPAELIREEREGRGGD
jgi:plasmid stability protein